jgi:inosine-uridine nucleoside N-ribohydrolase
MSNLQASVLCAALLAAGACAEQATTPRIPIVLDTDIGDDMDDTWALVLLLKSSHFDLKLVTTTFGKAEYRARIIAKLLTLAKRTDVAIGLGARGRTGGGPQEPWVQDYNLGTYAGQIYEDGVQALIDTLNASPQTMTLISIGPSNTVAAALDRQPGIAAKAVFVGMQGAVGKGYDGGPVAPEWNVKCNVPAARKVLLAPWKQTLITPLDTCGLVKLSGQRFQTLCESKDEMVKALLENYRIWKKKAQLSEIKESSVLFDTVAVYLASPEAKTLLEIEELNIGVTDGGLTAIDPAGAKMSVATGWKSLDDYGDFLVKTLQQPVQIAK